MPFGRLRFHTLGALAAALGLCTACTSTVDSLGKDKERTAANQLPPSLAPLHGPPTYDNFFKEVAKPDPPAQTLTDDDVDAKVEDAYQQLFHGNSNETMYFMAGDADADNEYYIYDIYHNDIRTEGMGIGMLVSVELNHQTEFDQLWNYAKRQMMQRSGASSGYFYSYCDRASGVVSCLDPYGMEMFAMSLIFAHDRWQTSTIAGIDYQADALALLDVMLHKEEQPGAFDQGFTNLFDTETLLVFDEPKVTDASRTRPSILMPAFYELWAQATGNAVFSAAADASRAFLQTAADSNTGLMPLGAYFDGNPVPGSDSFGTEAYRVFPNMVLDQIWTMGTAWNVTEFNRVLAFFLKQGIEKYGSAYYLDGTIVPDKTDHEIALVLVNGVTASQATSAPPPGVPAVADSDRQHFIQDAWNIDTPTGNVRYYQGIVQLFALCVLSGKMQVY